MEGQDALFEGGPPERAVREVAEAGVLVPRPPGWVLVANRSGPHGFHLIKSVGILGAVVSVCGVTGRKITESNRSIVLCPACVTASTV